MYSSLQGNSSNKTMYGSLQGNSSNKTMYSSLQGNSSNKTMYSSLQGNSSNKTFQPLCFINFNMKVKKFRAVGLLYLEVMERERRK